jgi:RNA methyltransferase, TrmH family
LLAKRSTRWSERAFVAEGAELLRAALASGAVPEAVYLAAGAAADPTLAALVAEAQARGSRVFDLAAGVAERVADTVTPQPVFSVLGLLDTDLSALGPLSLAVVCVDVRDPGNAGTVLRTADAAGADAVIWCGGTVDPFNPKAVRSSAGSVFAVPLVVVPDAAPALSALRERGLRCVGTAVRGGEDYAGWDWRPPSALVLGNEAAGLPAALLATLDGVVGIPMPGRAESLNVGVACGVVCFEILRQRRGPVPPAGSTMPGMSDPASPRSVE